MRTSNIQRFSTQSVIVDGVILNIAHLAVLFYHNCWAPVGHTGTAYRSGLPEFLSCSSVSRNAGRFPCRERSCNREEEREGTGGKAETGQDPPVPSSWMWTQAEPGVPGKTWSPTEVGKENKDSTKKKTTTEPIMCMTIFTMLLYPCQYECVYWVTHHCLWSFKNIPVRLRPTRGHAT